MMTFRGTYLRQLRLPVRTVRWMMEITESKGHQQRQARLTGELRRALREAAFVRNVESSSRMEGLTLATGRLLPLLAGRVMPTNESESEIYGYSRALNAIYEDNASSAITPSSLLTMHLTILSPLPDAGGWRNPEMKGNETNNQNLESNVLGVVLGDVPSYVQELCRSYDEALKDPSFHPLLAIASLLLDFECVRPFGRGQTRMAHLVALRCLHQNGFEVAKYVSLGRWFERTRNEWENALRQSSAGWEAGQHDVLPWLEYYFGVLRGAYQELEHAAERAKNPRGSKTVLVETAIDGFPNPFTLAELRQVCPGVSSIVVHRVLRQLREAQLIVRLRPGLYATRQRDSEPVQLGN